MGANIISLITDFSDKDQYVGLMKAVILKINPEARIIDLCHNIPPQDIKRASYILRSSYKYFPEGAIHVAVVDPGVGSKRRIICLEAAGQYFLAPDNGLLSIVVEGVRPKSIINVTNKRYFLKDVSHTFHGRDIFAPVAAYLSKGIEPDLLGKKINSIQRIIFPKPVVKDGAIIGEVIYIDNFGNLITNINESLITTLGRDPNRIKLKVKSRSIRGIKESYAQARSGALIGIIGSTGNLEISTNRKSAQRLLRAKGEEKIEITYDND